MERLIRIGAVAVLLTTLPAAAEPTPTEFQALVQRMADTAKTIRDYTCTFTKQERIDGELGAVETVFLKHLGPDVCVYMKWTKEPRKDREAIYCEGRFDDKLVAHEGSGFRSWVTVRLDPLGTLATSESRRPVTDSGIFNTIGFVADSFADGESKGGSIETIRRAAVHGQPSICAWVVPPLLPGEETVTRVEVCIHEELELPTRLQLEEKPGVPVATYTYRDYRLNVGLTDADFDPENDAYDF